MNAEQLWQEWGRLTRFYESARIGLQREKAVWDAMKVGPGSDARIVIASGLSTYEVTLDEHRAALQDSATLGTLVLLHRYALAESAAAFCLGDDAAISAGVEVWGQKLLERAAKDWNDVKDGKAGLVEVATIRNHLAHGNRTIDQGSLNRLAAAHAVGTWVVGATIEVGEDLVETHQARLKSLLRIAGVRK